MNKLPPSIRSGVWLRARPTLAAAWLAWAVFCGRAQGGVPIEFSQPTDGGFVTNLYGLAAPEEGRAVRDWLQQRQLSPSRLQVNEVGETLPMVGRSRANVATTKRQREELDRKKNWAFSLDEELGQDPALSEISKLTGKDRADKNQESETVMDRYIERVSDPLRDASAGDAGKNRSGRSEAEGSPMDKFLDKQASQTESVLRSLFDANPTGTLAARPEKEAGSGDSEDPALSSRGLAAQRSRMSEFMQLLEGRPGEAAALGKSEPARGLGLSALSGASASAAVSPISPGLGQLAGGKAPASLPPVQPRLPSSARPIRRGRPTW